MQQRILAQQYKSCHQSRSLKVFFPHKDNPFLWHVSFVGAADTPFEGGYYHCQLDLSGYPQKAPSIIMLNDSGSYEVNKKLCIVGVTDYHPEAWSQGTSIDAVVAGLQTYMNIEDPNYRTGIGMIRVLDARKIKEFAKNSRRFRCPCGCDHSKIHLQVE